MLVMHFRSSRQHGIVAKWISRHAAAILYAIAWEMSRRVDYYRGQYSATTCAWQLQRKNKYDFHIYASHMVNDTYAAMLNMLRMTLVLHHWRQGEDIDRDEIWWRW